MTTNTLSIAPLTRGSRWTLAASGLLLVAVGLPIMVGPLAYQAGMGVELPDAPTLLSDLRAMGGSLLGFGALLLASARWPDRLGGRAAALAGAVLFSGYGLSRVLSMGLDGLPASALIGSAAIELVVGGLLASVALRGKIR